MGYQAAPDGSLVLPCGLYQFMSITEGKALLFESKWLLYPAFGSPLPTPPPLTHPLPIDSIHDIITTLFIQNMWRDYIAPQARYNALNILN